ncbi:MAG: 5'/3'-nucleotidase SurE [Acidimicrobiales bacterium]|nr:5'/3'-nucleotidase SurE [Acidimicrobiales bacterium]
MTFILITNDDGIASPAVPALFAALRGIAERVEVVVPDQERSWIGKAISRHGSIDVHEVSFDGHVGYTAGGTPADCAQLGIYNLFDATPDLVVSGINIGANHGSAYTIGSGTVGAAVEAAIAGIPALAASASSRRDNWPEWNTTMRRPDAVPRWEPLAEITAAIAAEMLAAPPADVDVLCANYPDGATPATPRRVVPLAETHYGQLFQRQPQGHYAHDWTSDMKGRTETAGTDVATVLDDECVAITPLRLAGLAAPVQGLERFAAH